VLPPITAKPAFPIKKVDETPVVSKEISKTLKENKTSKTRKTRTELLLILEKSDNANKNATLLKAAYIVGSVFICILLWFLLCMTGVCKKPNIYRVIG
jgi:hypothetical protein